jgi:hypothetical protein
VCRSATSKLPFGAEEREREREREGSHHAKEEDIQQCCYKHICILLTVGSRGRWEKGGGATSLPLLGSDTEEREARPGLGGGGRQAELISIVLILMSGGPIDITSGSNRSVSTTTGGRRRRSRGGARRGEGSHLQCQ